MCKIASTSIHLVDDREGDAGDPGASCIGYFPSLLLECQTGPRSRFADLEPALSLRGVPDPRSPALLLQAPTRLRPGWRFVGRLNPMGQRRLIAPVWKPSHNAAMDARLHKRTHGRLVAPHRAGPESAIGIAKDRNRKASGRALSLARGAERADQELRHMPPRPNPQPGDRYERHQPRTPNFRTNTSSL
jgi:hypothetical protein